MAQKVLPYKYEIKEEKTGMTELGGLPTYLDLAAATGLMKSIDRNLKIRRGDQGWTDRQMVLSSVMLNLPVGDCEGDIEKLQGDEGRCGIGRKVETCDPNRKANE